MADFLFDATIHYTDTTTFDCTVDVTNAPNATQAVLRVAPVFADHPGLWGSQGKTFLNATAAQRTRP